MGFGKKLGKSEKGFIKIGIQHFDPAWAYMDTIGKVYSMTTGGYLATVGKIHGMEMGAYVNRE